MGRRRKQFLGTKTIGGKTSRSKRVARAVTSQYHAIRNEMNGLLGGADPDGLPLAAQRRVRELAAQLDGMGGVQRYQEASMLTTSQFKTSKHFLSTLEALGKVPAAGSKLKVFEIGAVNIQLQSCSWLDVYAIDVNSQHPRIREEDFFDVAPRFSFDVVVCCMVLNCVPSAAKRGEMLARLACHVAPQGVLFLVLPLRCVESPLVGGPAFDALLDAFKLKQLLPVKRTPKLAFYTLSSCIADGRGDGEADPGEWERLASACVRNASPAVRTRFSDTADPSSAFSIHLPAL